MFDTSQFKIFQLRCSGTRSHGWEATTSCKDDGVADEAAEANIAKTMAALKIAPKWIKVSWTCTKVSVFLSSSLWIVASSRVILSLLSVFNDRSWWTPCCETLIDTFWRNLMLMLALEQTKLESPGINMGQVFKQESVYVVTAHSMRTKCQTVNWLPHRHMVFKRTQLSTQMSVREPVTENTSKKSSWSHATWDCTPGSSSWPLKYDEDRELNCTGWQFSHQCDGKKSLTWTVLWAQGHN